MTVAPQQSILDGLADLIGPRLPGTKTDGRDLVAGVESVGFSIRQTSVSLSSLRLSRNKRQYDLLGVVRHFAQLDERITFELVETRDSMKKRRTIAPAKGGLYRQRAR